MISSHSCHTISEVNGQYLVNALPAVFDKNPEIEMAKAAAQMLTDLAKSMVQILYLSVGVVQAGASVYFVSKGLRH